MTSIDPGEVARRLETVRGRIRDAGGADVAVLAVTKGFGVDAVRAAVEVGLAAVGENYAQELLAKAAATADDAVVPSWHLIGRLQRNKVRQLAPWVAVWQSVDRRELAAEIAKRAPGARVFIQINLSEEPQKGGCPFGEVTTLVDQSLELGLDVAGLMGVAPAGTAESSRPGFRRLVELADALGLPERSIGMSGDLEVAVQEGATMVRVGTGLFGDRPPR